VDSRAKGVRLRPPDGSLESLQNCDLATMDVHVHSPMELVEISSLPDPQTDACHVDWHVELIIGERVE